MFLGAQNGFHFGPKGANNLDLQSQSTRYPRWAGYEVVRASMMMNSVMIMLMVVVALRLPQVFYNQGLSSLRRSVSYVRAEH